MLAESTPSISNLQNAGRDLDGMTILIANSTSSNASIKNLRLILLGDLSVSDPPDPISNSAVKAVCANGTNAQALEE